MSDESNSQSNVVSLSTNDPISEAAPSTEAASQPFAERLSDQLQRIIGVLIGSNRKPPRRFKSFLNGTWFGHPLHPVLTAIPVGGWVMAAIFDVIWLISPVTFAWAARGAEVAVIFGILGALGAAGTGFADWSDTYGSERRVGLNHAIYNSSALLLYIVSLVLRLTQNSGDSIAAAIIGFVGLCAMSYAAYLGGEMVFTKGTNVNHTAWEAGGDNFEGVMPAEQVEENKLYRVVVSGVPVVLLRQGMQFYAISATCSHAGGPLDEGHLEGDVVQCPWHGSRFCVRDGRVLTGPATANAPRYDVRIQNGQVEARRAGSH
jgi:nitrite reductase/ring-hydroxylating ferredoxin subunit/uncharacterized membrane protein